VLEAKNRSIGVMNFNSTRISELMNTAKIKPAVNQVSAGILVCFGKVLTALLEQLHFNP
jgi:diketogulonate reductase-like aldo/keto reductase